MEYKKDIQSLSMRNVFTRFITSAIVLAIAMFFTPGFEIQSIWTLLLISLILTLLDYIINSLFDNKLNPFSKSVVGFLISVIVFYSAQFFIINYSITLPSAIIGALIYAVVASF